MSETNTPRSYKVGVKTPGDTTWASNALRFRTRDEAEWYGRDLFNRWFLVEKWEVQDSDDVPNTSVVDNRLVHES